MQMVNISDFRSNLLKYLERANAGELISVTTNGRVLATITAPVNQQEIARKQLREVAEQSQIYDVVTPTGSDWNVQK